jgi:trans-aconitate 2-methyltransferase
VDNKLHLMGARNYTFGDTDEASVRLRRLAVLYEPETRELLLRGRTLVAPRGTAIDLGCGPGWSTQLLRDVLRPGRTIGMDASERFIEQARQNHGADIEFRVEDAVRGAFPARPDALLCRFLLTHLANAGDVLTAWAGAAAPGAILFIHETESLETDNATLDRYYELVALLQEHYGQTLYVGGLLEAFVRQAGWEIIESERLKLEKPAQKMAELHLANLRTWKSNDFARRTFDAREIEGLEASLARIACGEEEAGVVVNAARQIIARRPSAPRRF